MAALYRIWDRHPVRLDRLAGQLLNWLGVADGAMGQFCRRLAEALDAWGGHPYHSAAHHAEVAVNAMVLTALDGALAQRDAVLLLAAALAHDLRYDPARPRVPFSAEAASADAADAIAQSCGLDVDTRRDLRRLILATEPTVRSRLHGNAPSPLEGAGGAAEGFARESEWNGSGGWGEGSGAHDISRTGLRRLATMLSDADMLSSAGLTVRWHQVQRARLERELGQKIAPTADLAWFDQVVGPRFLSAGGDHFTANLQRIREAATHGC